MLSREEIKLIGEVLNTIQSTDRDDVVKLRMKVNLIIEQLEVQEKAQSEMAKIQEKMYELEGDSNEDNKEEK